MLAMPPPLFSTPTPAWPLEEELTGLEHNILDKETETSESVLVYSPSSMLQEYVGLLEQEREPTLIGSTADGDDATMIKKLDHNANERHRRKRINSLFSNLRSMLPASAEQMSKLSIPATLSRVLKYIPEVRKEVEKLVQKKEDIVSKISREDDLVLFENQRKPANQCSSSTVSASWLGANEVAIQISTVHKDSLSEALLCLEEAEFVLQNASSFESSGGRIFYNLHLQHKTLLKTDMADLKAADSYSLRIMQGTQRLEIEMLRQKLLSLYENKNERKNVNCTIRGQLWN